MTQPVIETERLLLRSFVPADAADVQLLAGEKPVAETTLSIPHPYPDGAAQAWIGMVTEAWCRRTEVCYAITDRGSGRLYGAIGLKPLDRDVPELGYWVGLPFWNRGYCTEAADAFVRYSLGTLGKPGIRAEYLIGNPASGRVMQKIGMQWLGTGTRIDRYGRDAQVGIYEIRRAW